MSSAHRRKRFRHAAGSGLPRMAVVPQVNPLISAKITPILRGAAASIALGGVGAVSWAASPAAAVPAAAAAVPAATSRATAVIASSPVPTSAEQQTAGVADSTGDVDIADVIGWLLGAGPEPTSAAQQTGSAASAADSAASAVDPATPNSQSTGSTTPSSYHVSAVQPVAGLDQVQMDNAAAIVAAGKQLNLPSQAYVVAIATALQESQLRNLANPNVAGSMDHPNEGVGYDHDSVGLFQQRPNWGTVDQLMDPQEAARRFYAALVQIPGWERMAVTVAAQTVQQSAFPDAYARHQALAEQVVAALG